MKLQIPVIGNLNRSCFKLDGGTIRLSCQVGTIHYYKVIVREAKDRSCYE
jgi:hypothetical protein